MIMLVLVLYGLIFGSFVNALVWRVKQQSDASEHVAAQASSKATGAAGRKKRPTVSKDELSLLKGRSMCSHCHHPLAAKDLVPLFSWLYLRGKCRYCRVKIQDNPLIEVITPLLFVISYLCWPQALHGVGLVQFIVWLLFLVGFMALAVYDLRWFLLPDRIVFPLVGLAAVEVVVVAIMKHDAWFALNAVIGAVLLSGIFWTLFQVSDGAWIGGGDVKLALVLGLLAGSAVQSMLVLFGASLIGTLLSVPILLRGKSGLKLKVPFGPYLLAGTFVVVLFGQRIADWYMNLLV